MHHVNSRKYLKLALLLVFLLIIALASYKVYDQLTFRVVSTNPGPDNVAAVTPFFNISFNKPLSGNGLSVSSEPSIISAYKVSDNTLNISLNGPLDLNQTYTIRVTNVSDLAGKHVNDLQYVFTPHDIPSSDLPNDQKQTLLNKQADFNQKVENDPLIQLLPFVGGGLEFKVDYTLQDKDGTSQPVITITAPTQQGQQDGLNWIRSLGFDPSNYKIEFLTATVQQ